ncbi:YegS/Rv2252/BmrU family lipid kinase [Ancylomarina salipaludis]|uniref:YegS/Rv2252/BmrU family lipid kinase n=1 Tax=Ancylomarina salipaludis TaxID=2501299 RepID=A0A4Q1JLV1_9BACT|nr:YegS/Rv2252/BmrU family lipid kinase [Ancylomarina salipaludis]RXQ95044.1 YegS/Rv2252/BmrU family lipid kinase [Ancylomarina salipaludis]
MQIEARDILFIINPNSGKQKPDTIIKQIKNSGHDIDYVLTQSLQEFNDLFIDKIKNYKVVVICGGDGSVNCTLKHLVAHEELVLAVLPNGSGNGFARELGFTNNVEHLICNMLKGEIREVDIAKVNNDYSINVAGLGFDSHVASLFDGSKFRGLKKYIYCTLKGLFSYKPIEVELFLGQIKLTGNFWGIYLANTRQFGNNAIIAPEAKYDDGLLEVVLMKKYPLILSPILVYKMFTGKLKNSKYMTYLRASELTIKSNSKTYHLDGEPMAMTKDLNISLLKRRIKVVKMN